MNDNPDKVVYPSFVTRLDIPAERVIGAAAAAGLTNVVVLGYDEDGDEYFASSYASGAEVVWLLERCKFKLMQIGSGDE